MRRATRTTAAAPALQLRPLVRCLHEAVRGHWPLLVMAGLAAASGVAQAQLAPNALPVPAPRWLQAGSAASLSQAGSAMRVQLSDPATVLNWNSLDVGSASTLTFAMPSSTARVLNNVQGGAIANRTTIDGALRSNGQVYIYNPNGIVFGPGSTVNVDSLVASTLRIDPTRFMAGLLSPDVAANLAMDPAAARAPGSVVLQSDGSGGALRQAAITAARNGLVLLAAPQVDNRGVISAPDGQVVLAAGSKVYLAAPTDPAMRGLRVEVSSDGLAALGAQAAAGNSGTLSVERGNITMAGFAVRQDGVASATTSVNLNGSIYLLARDGASKASTNSVAVASRGGSLTLGAGSSTTVQPTLDDPTTAQVPPAGQAFKPSQVELSGGTIRLAEGARVVAPAGVVNVTARANPGDIATASAANGSSIELAPGSVIDVSGSTSTVLPVSANVVSAELRGTELADNVLLRDSALRGSTVRFDVRKAPGGLAIANVQGYINLVEQNVGQQTAAGGTVSLRSEGRVALQPGSRVDVSGGQVSYTGGTVETTKLTLGGRLYDIETAPANLAYDGAVLVRSTETGYVQGRSAGTVQVSAPDLQLGGTLAARTVNGPAQRDLAASGTPTGGTLLIGNVGTSTMDAGTGRASLGAQDQFVFARDIVVNGNTTGALTLDTAALASEGFTRVQALTTGSVRIAAGTSVPTGGRLWLGSVGAIDVQGDLQGAGAAVSLTSAYGVHVAPFATIDLAGRWQNDSAAAEPSRDTQGRPDARIATAGGALRIYGNQVSVGGGVKVDVSGGAWMNSAGKTSAGAAGSIVLQATTQTGALDGSLQLGNGVEFLGYGLSRGGSLSLTARNVGIGGAAPGFSAEDLLLAPDFFARGGFASRSITANGNLVVAAGATVAPRSQTWQLASDAAQRASGAMRAVATPALLPLASTQGSRPASSLTLRAGSLPDPAVGTLSLGTGATIDADPGASVTLSADRQVRIDGTVNAPAGTITAAVQTTPVDPAAGDGSGFGVWLGPNARLLARGTADRLVVDAAGVSSGEVLDGGTVRIGRVNAGVTESNTGRVVMEQGALIDVSGAVRDAVVLRSGSAVQPPASVASAGGTIEIKAQGGLQVAGRLVGAGGDATAHGGSLLLGLDSEGTSAAPVVLTVSAADPATVLPAGTGAGQRLTSADGSGTVATASMAQGGFANVRLKSQDTLVLAGAGAGGAGTLALKAGASLTLDAPNIDAASAGVNVQLQAPLVTLGNSDVRYQDGARAATSGGASLTVQSRVASLVGASATHGFGEVRIGAREDLRLSGTAGQDSFGASGSFATGRHLVLSAAQVYPDTLTAFSLSANGDRSLLEILPSGTASAQEPLSAAGRVTASADTIVQAGVLRAPFGSITLQAGSALRYEAGSLTSVAASTAVPFGSVVNGSGWTYTIGSNTVTYIAKPSANPDANEQALPAREIVSRAPSVTQAAGATLDLGGGGKLTAYEFTPGPGGSSDVLQSSGGAANRSFAILPGYTGTLAPSDAEFGNDGLRAGDQVWLSGFQGLPAGYYTLLPAHYALQAGGYLIEPVSGARDMGARDNRVNADGSLTVAGYRASALDGLRDARSQGFRLSDGALVRRRSEFKEYDATTFFAAQAAQAGVQRPAGPADGGHAVFDVSRALDLAGTTRLQADSGVAGARRGTVDLAAPGLEVTATRAAPAGDRVQVLADQLTAMQADSLLLGGLRRSGDGVQQVQVVADSVRIANDAAHPLAAAEVVLAARDTLQLATRSSLQATAPMTGTAQTLALDAAAGSGNGAVLRVSGSSGADVQRPAFDGRQGRLEIQPGATVAAGGSLLLDATGSMALDAVPAVAGGSDVVLRAPALALGSPATVTPGAARLDATALQALGRAGTLELTSYGDLDVWGTVQLGASATRSLKLGAATVRAHGPVDMRVSADRIVLSGSGTAADPARDASAASLRIEANDLQLGGGTLRVQGFGQTLLRSAGALRTGADGGAVIADNGLTIDAARIAAASGADLQLSAGDGLVTRFTGTPGALGSAPAGGSVLLSGRTVRSGTDVAAPSGRITLQAAEGLEVTGGTLDAHGATTVFAGTSVTAPAGSVLLDGGSGDVRLDAPARIDVSAASGSAGSLAVRATGRAGASVQLDGSIAGASGGKADDAATRQGSFSLDVAALADPAALDALNTRLNGAGFTESRSLRVRSGDVRVGAGTVVQAHDIDIAADNGNLSVAGTLDARGSAGGSITLSAGQSTAAGDAGRLNLEATARLLASATTVAISAAGSAGDGGRVLLSTANADGAAARRADGGASLRAASGALIDVSGAGQGQGGSLVLRAPRVGDGAGTDVAVAGFGARVDGAADARIEAVKVYQAATISDRADSATNLNAGLGGRLATEADRFMASAPAVQQRLGRQDLLVTTGIEVRSAGDLDVSVNENALDRGDRGWNLNTWRFGGQAGTLTLRAGGNLSVRGSISDGFVRTGAADAAPAWRLDSSPVSWSLRLVGGSDLASAQVLGVRPASGSGDVSLGFGRAGTDGDVPVSVVRTGTGRIDVAAGRDVVLARSSFTTVDGDTVQSGAQLYTAGRAVLPDAGFSAPQNALNPVTSTAGGTTSAQFGAGGGGIRIEAQRNVQGPAMPQLVNNWLFRQGRSGVDANGNRVFDTDGNGGTTNTAWWVRPDWFSQGVATFGGGDIAVVARQGNVTDLSANVATSAWMPGSAPDAAALREQGGGNLRVQAGGSIQGGSFYAQKGDIRLQAGRDVSAGTLKVQDLLASTTDTDVSTALRPVIAIGDGRVDVTAGRNLAIETVYNPTLARQGLGNVDSGLAYDSAFLDFDNRSPAALAYRRAYAQYGAFSTYGAGNAVRLVAAGGDAQLSNNTLLAANAGGAAQPLSDYGRNLAQLLSLYPGSLQVAAPQGSVRIDAGMALAPSATGQLDLLAGKDVHLGSNDVLYPGTVMLDSDPSRLLSASQPGVLRQSDLGLLRGTASGLSAHTPGGLHAQDTQPVHVVALQGDVSGTAGVAASLIVPKAVSVVAGQDIRDLGLTIQHGSDSAVSVLQAGRDIIDTTNLTVAGPVRHTVGGGGLAVFSAGRNVDLGNAQGIVTRGNLDNPYLAEGGASVMVEAGVQATRASLTDPAATAAANAALATTLFAQSKQALDQAATQAAAAGVGLNSPAGIAIRDKALADFDATIAAAWQAGAVGSGDIKVFGSQVKTEQGGSIDLLAPGGSVIAGLVTIPSYLNKPAADNGIFTIRGGDIRSVVRNDFTVNQGRVFTLGGGDIALISQFGNIDAGRGSKTAASVPPPLLTTDAAGNTRIDIAGSISGSGIATLRASETKPAGNVLAAAPRGIFDAGDAGVRSSGKVEVQASVVLNAGNIAAGGGVSGSSAVTTAMAPAAPASPAAAPAVADPATTQSRSAPREALPLSVDVVCYGSDGERACKDGEDGSAGEGQRPAAAPAPAGRR